MAVSATVTVADNNGVHNAEFYPSGSVTFNVIIVNPCTAANGVSISPLGFSPSNPVVVDGESGFTQWFRPTTSVDVAHDSVGGMCGPLTYEVFADTSDTLLRDHFTADWASVSEPVDGTYRLTFDTSLDQSLLDDQSQLQIPLYIKSTLVNWGHSEYD